MVSTGGFNEKYIVLAPRKISVKWLILKSEKKSYLNADFFKKMFSKRRIPSCSLFISQLLSVGDLAQVDE